MIDNEEIERKRQELRNERNANSHREQSGETNTNLKRYSAIADGTARSSIPAIGRTSETVRSTSGETRSGDTGNASAQRSSEAESVRERPGRRRLGSPKPSTPDNTEAPREPSPATFGSIERIDGTFYRPDVEEKKSDKKAENIVTKLVSKLPDSSEDIPFFGSGGKPGKTFSKTEAKEQYEALKEAISDYGDYLDIYMQKIEPEHPDTWGNFTEKELDIVTRALLRRAQTDARAASFARLMIDGQDYIGAFVILIPRVVVTIQFANRRIPRRMKKGKAIENQNRQQGV